MMKVKIDGRSVTLELEDGRCIHLSANDTYLHVNVERTTGMVVTGGTQPGQGKELGVSNIANIHYDGKASTEKDSLIQPISPKSVGMKKCKTIPPEVIEIVNNLIVKHWDGNSAKIELQEVRKEIANKFDMAPDGLNKDWLAFEPVYRNVGWHCKLFSVSGIKDYYQFIKVK